MLSPFPNHPATPSRIAKSLPTASGLIAVTPNRILTVRASGKGSELSLWNPVTGRLLKRKSTNLLVVGAGGGVKNFYLVGAAERGLSIWLWDGEKIFRHSTLSLDSMAMDPDIYVWESGGHLCLETVRPGETTLAKFYEYDRKWASRGAAAAYRFPAIQGTTFQVERAKDWRFQVKVAMSGLEKTVRIPRSALASKLKEGSLRVGFSSNRKYAVCLRHFNPNEVFLIGKSEMVVTDASVLTEEDGVVLGASRLFILRKGNLVPGPSITAGRHFALGRSESR